MIPWYNRHVLIIIYLDNQQQYIGGNMNKKIVYSFNKQYDFLSGKDPYPLDEIMDETLKVDEVDFSSLW